MTITDQFVLISNLICESSRARILWNLLDGRAYTATELAYAADISPTTCSNHLAKLLEGKILKVETQGRHRYYNFYSEEVANVVESLATLAQEKTEDKSSIPNGVKYCRTCYDHLAGYIGVQLTNTLETKGYIQKELKEYKITTTGWIWLAQLNIYPENFTYNSRRPLARQCLDWSERRHHLSGQLGAILLEYMLHNDWCRRVTDSREIIFTSKGKQHVYELLNLIII